jgi:alpha- and gamma-adaptin-binding protein p34
LEGENPKDDEAAEYGDKNDSEFDPEGLDFGFDKEDFVGLKQAIWSVGRGDENDEEDRDPDEQDVQKLEGMMRKLQAVRDTSVGLQEEQRKRLARRAVSEVMKDL